MSDLMIALTPVLVLLIVAFFGFTGCGGLLPVDADPEVSKDPRDKFPPRSGLSVNYPTAPDPVPTPGASAYAKAVLNTNGIAAYWPLNEQSGMTAQAFGPLAASATGTYRNSHGQPTAAGFSLGNSGALQPKETDDFAPSFTTQEAHIDVDFQDQLNPQPTVVGFSIELWIKPDPSAQPDQQVIVSSHFFGSPVDQQGYEIGLMKVAGQAHQQVYGRVYSATNPRQSDAFAQPTAGAATDWRLVVFTYEQPMGAPATIRVSVRVKGTSVRVSSNPEPANYGRVTATNSSTLRFGASHGSAPGLETFYTGQIDNIAFYNAPLPDSVIDDHFKLA